MNACSSKLNALTTSVERGAAMNIPGALYAMHKVLTEAPLILGVNSLLKMSQVYLEGFKGPF